MSHKARMAFVLMAVFGVGLLTVCCYAAPEPAPTSAPAAATTASRPATTSAPAAEPLTVVDRQVAAGDVLIVRYSNGLTAVIKPMHNAPVVHVECTVQTGGMYERQWLGAGISHLVEHLVASDAVHEDQSGAAAAPKPSAVTEIGGQSNASTSMEHTTYYISASAGKTRQCIDMIAGWMARPTFTEADFNREHGVVQRELEMGKDSPQRQLWYTHMANLYRTHPAAVPVIGYAAPLAALKFKDVVEYHARMYVPQNMYFSVVGDIDPQTVVADIAAAFAGFQTGRAPDLSLPQVQKVDGTRRVVAALPSMRETMEEAAFQTVSLLGEDLYALDLLSAVLGQGESSRLTRKIQRDQKLVTGVGTGSFTPAWGKGAFSFSFTASPDKADAAEAAIIAELKRVVADGVTAEELATAKRQIIAEFVYGSQTVSSVSSRLVTDLMSVGDVEFSSRYTSKIKELTAEQLQAVARKYFDFDRMVITRVVPRAKDATTQATTQAAKDMQATAFTLPNGLRVVLKPIAPTAGMGIVSMVFASRGGLLLEDKATNGLGSMMAELATQGAGDMTAEQIATFFDQAGGSLNATCGNNSTFWQATVLDDSFDKALSVFADVVTKPAFDQKELDILRPRMLAAIDRIDQNPNSQLQRFFREKFFAGTPYEMLPSGSKQVVEAAKPADLKAYHKNNIKAGSSVLAIYGTFDVAAAKSRIEKLFADVPSGEVKVPNITKATTAPAGSEFVLTTENKQAAIIVAEPGMKVSDIEDRLPIDVLDTIISGWQLPSGWLHDDLRGKQLVYVVHAYNYVGLAPGAFITYALCQPKDIIQVRDIIIADLKKAADYTPTQKEVDRAVNTILTAELLENQSISALATMGALDELYGFGYDFRSKIETLYRKVTPQDVHRVGSKYIKDFVVVITRPKEGK